MSNYDVILHPTDFSHDSDEAFRLACNMARDQFSSLVVVHALPPEGRSYEEPDADLTDLNCPVMENCRRHFQRMQSWASDIPISFRVVRGNTVNVILMVAHQEKAELIVIASHRHTHFHLQLHGSVAEGLLRQAHCPVLVLRQPVGSNRCHIGQMFSNQRESLETK